MMGNNLSGVFPSCRLKPEPLDPAPGRAREYLLDPPALAAESSNIPIVKRRMPGHLVQNPLTLPLCPLSGHPASRYEKGQ